jgi:hypothetical protein
MMTIDDYRKWLDTFRAVIEIYG